MAEVFSASTCDDSDVGEGVRDGGVGFVDGDFDGVDAIVEDEGIGDLAGDGFDEVAAGPADGGVNEVGDAGVADRVREVVGGGGLAEVGPHGDVGKKPLTIALFVREYPVVPVHLDACEFYSVSHVVLSILEVRRVRGRWPRRARL